MPDYSIGTGTGGALIISDDGYTVRAIVRSTNGATNIYAPGKGWSVYVGGGSASGLFQIRGAQDVVVWAGPVTSTLSMQFNIAATGTSGLGGPTSLNVTIVRNTPPGPMIPIGLDQIGPTSMRYRFEGTSSGGLAIDNYQIGYGTDPVYIQTLIDYSTGTTVVEGLSPGTEYYFWSRAHNPVGWGVWSERINAKTLGPVRLKVGNAYKFGIPYVKINGIYRMAQPYVKAGGTYRKTG